MNPRRISSTSNAIIKEAARLKRKRHRYHSRLFLVEGEDLLDAALARGIVPRQVFVLEDYEDLLSGEDAQRLLTTRPTPQTAPTDIYSCSRAVMDKLSELGSGSRVIAAFEMLDRKFPAGLGAAGADPGNGVAVDDGMSSGPLLYLAGAADPGNVGSMMRSAKALGVSAVVMGPQTADPYAPKALRATMGAIFQLPIFLTVNPESLVSWAEQAEIPVVCADAHAGVPVWEAALAGTFVLVMGSEREGVPHRLTDAAVETVHIPQLEETESINVAMAGTVILYEAFRQRSGNPD
ncbi:MAG: RNA methyltransferase [Thermoleophilia bacterium]